MNKRFFAECEREQLHLSGLIQPHGALLVADQSLRITHRSTNLGGYLDEAITRPGAPLPPKLAAFSEALPTHGGARRLILNALPGDDTPVDLMIGRNDDGGLLVELVPSAEHGEDGPPEPGRAIVQPRDQAELKQRTRTLVERIFDRSGFSRVMFYRFREDGDGEVVAEAHDPEVYGSYLGLRFPASDIPQIARDLYQRNPWRLIPDAQAKPIGIEGQGGPPDLSRADLRSISPVHQVYMANMGVRASLSLPVMVAGQLQGLIACHHPLPLRPPLALLEVLSNKARSFGLVLTSFLAQNRIKLVDGLVRRFSAGKEIVSRTGSLLDAWDALAPLIADHFDGDGAHLLLGDEHRTWGLALEPDALDSLDERFGDSMAEALWLSDSLGRDMPNMPLSRVAGVLALKGRAPDGRSLRVYLTRQEYIHEVAWGGNPDKPVEYHDGTHGIAPRRSFEKWVEKRMGHSRPWDNESRLLGLRLREMLVDVARHY